jgi:hypothetical protein
MAILFEKFTWLNQGLEESNCEVSHETAIIRNEILRMILSIFITFAVKKEFAMGQSKDSL